MYITHLAAMVLFGQMSARAVRPFETPHLAKGASPSAVSAMRPRGRSRMIQWLNRTFSKGEKTALSFSILDMHIQPEFLLQFLKVHGCRLFKNALYVEGSCFHKKAYVKTIKDGLPFSHQIH